MADIIVCTVDSSHKARFADKVNIAGSRQTVDTGNVVQIVLLQRSLMRLP